MKRKPNWKQLPSKFKKSKKKSTFTSKHRQQAVFQPNPIHQFALRTESALFCLWFSLVPPIFIDPVLKER